MKKTVFHSVELQYKCCDYCYGNMELVIVSHHVKRHPAAGGKDLNIHQEYKVQMWRCLNCDGKTETEIGHRNGEFRTCMRGMNGVICQELAARKDVALSLPGISIILPVSSDEFSRSGCSSCLRCEKCKNPLNSRDLVYTSKVTDFHGTNFVDVYKYYHSSCIITGTSENPIKNLSTFKEMISKFFDR